MAINKQEHAQWSSSLGFVLAAVGSAVGLGNIWKFPYMVGESGGSAFVIAYLFCIALVGFPILVAEWLIGRRGQKNPVNSFTDVAASEGEVKKLGNYRGFRYFRWVPDSIILQCYRWLGAELYHQDCLWWLHWPR